MQSGKRKIKKDPLEKRLVFNEIKNMDQGKILARKEVYASLNKAFAKHQHIGMSASDDNDTTPLMLAVKLGNYAAVEWLLDNDVHWVGPSKALSIPKKPLINETDKLDIPAICFAVAFENVREAKEDKEVDNVYHVGGLSARRAILKKLLEQPGLKLNYKTYLWAYAFNNQLFRNIGDIPKKNLFLNLANIDPETPVTNASKAEGYLWQEPEEKTFTNQVNDAIARQFHDAIVRLLQEKISLSKDSDLAKIISLRAPELIHAVLFTTGSYAPDRAMILDRSMRSALRDIDRDSIDNLDLPFNIQQLLNLDTHPPFGHSTPLDAFFKNFKNGFGATTSGDRQAIFTKLITTMPAFAFYIITHDNDFGITNNDKYFKEALQIFINDRLKSFAAEDMDKFFSFKFTKDKKPFEINLRPVVRDYLIRLIWESPLELFQKFYSNETRFNDFLGSQWANLYLFNSYSSLTQTDEAKFIAIAPFIKSLDTDMILYHKNKKLFNALPKKIKEDTLFSSFGAYHISEHGALNLVELASENKLDLSMISHTPNHKQTKQLTENLIKNDKRTVNLLEFFPLTYQTEMLVNYIKGFTSLYEFPSILHKASQVVESPEVIEALKLKAMEVLREKHTDSTATTFDTITAFLPPTEINSILESVLESPTSDVYDKPFNQNKFNYLFNKIEEKHPNRQTYLKNATLSLAREEKFDDELIKKLSHDNAANVIETLLLQNDLSKSKVVKLSDALLDVIDHLFMVTKLNIHDLFKTEINTPELIKILNKLLLNNMPEEDEAFNPRVMNIIFQLANLSQINLNKLDEKAIKQIQNYSYVMGDSNLFKRLLQNKIMDNRAINEDTGLPRGAETKVENPNIDGRENISKLIHAINIIEKKQNPLKKKTDVVKIAELNVLELSMDDFAIIKEFFNNNARATEFINKNFFQENTASPPPIVSNINDAKENLENIHQSVEGVVNNKEGFVNTPSGPPEETSSMEENNKIDESIVNAAHPESIVNTPNAPEAQAELQGVEPLPKIEEKNSEEFADVNIAENVEGENIEGEVPDEQPGLSPLKIKTPNVPLQPASIFRPNSPDSPRKIVLNKIGELNELLQTLTTEQLNDQSVKDGLNRLITTMHEKTSNKKP